MIMDWPVTSKPYAIAAGDGKVRSNSKIFLEIIYKVYVKYKAFK